MFQCHGVLVLVWILNLFGMDNDPLGQSRSGSLVTVTEKGYLWSPDPRVGDYTSGNASLDKIALRPGRVWDRSVSN